VSKVNLNKLKTYSIYKRQSKVDVKNFAKPNRRKDSFSTFFASLPNILAAKDFKGLVEAIAKARTGKKAKPVIFMLGAHVIKCGLNPIIIDLMKKGIISAIALNGAGVIHDVELAMVGRTSEDVAKAIINGSFGMAKETAQVINDAISRGALKKKGIGESVGAALAKGKMPYKKYSILYNARKLNIPVTVHVGIGTDIIHQHPSCDGAALGEASLMDFHTLINEVAGLKGGVVVNVGSAVILPEVFLKALSVARNLKFNAKGFTTANLDMLPHYRPHQNIVLRPTLGSGKGYMLVGHHEIMLPLLHRAIIEKCKR